MRKPEAGGEPAEQRARRRGPRNSRGTAGRGRKGGRPFVQRRVDPGGRRWAQCENEGASERGPLSRRSSHGSACSTSWDFLIF